MPKTYIASVPATGVLLSLAVALVTGGCGQPSTPSTSQPTTPPPGDADPPPTFSICGSIENLVGSGLVLQNRGADDLAIAAGAQSFTFASSMQGGEAYAVTVLNQPTNPPQECAVERGAGIVVEADVCNVRIVCRPVFSISGTVSGLTGGGLTLRNRGEEITVDPAAPSFTFTTLYPDNDWFQVEVVTHPSAPTQLCTPVGGSHAGFFAGANVDSVAFECVDAFNLLIHIVDLEGSGLVIQESGAGSTTSFAVETPNPPLSSIFWQYPMPFADGSPYALQVIGHPSGPNQICEVTLAGPGVVSGADVVGIEVVCSHVGFQLGGTVEGLVGVSLIVAFSPDDPTCATPAQSLTIDADGEFTFPNLIADGSSYNVCVQSQPSLPTQNCSVVRYGSGAIWGAPVRDVAIVCGGPLMSDPIVFSTYNQFAATGYGASHTEITGATLPDELAAGTVTLGTGVNAGSGDYGDFVCDATTATGGVCTLPASRAFTSFRVEAGFTTVVTPSTMLIQSQGDVTILGTLQHANGSTTGPGTGGDGYESGWVYCGCAGSGFGGAGGAGGCGDPDTVIAGGATYGDSWVQRFVAGSGHPMVAAASAAQSSTASKGGGALRIISGGNIDVSGTIDVSGVDGNDGWGAISGGGSSGGALILDAAGAITISGAIRARGGNGGVGTRRCPNGRNCRRAGGGGGGGGGRVRLIAASVVGLDLVDISGGAGGTGNYGNGQAGAPGSLVVTESGGGFISESSYVSPVIDLTAPTRISLGYFEWTLSLPAGSAGPLPGDPVGFQLAVADTATGPWLFMGPGGSEAADDRFLPGGVFGALGDAALLDGPDLGYRYVRFRLLLTTADPAVAPSVDEVVLHFPRTFP